MFQTCFMTSKMLNSTLRNSFHLSGSSRRPKDVKMVRVTLFTERGRCWGYCWDYKLFSLFVLHEEFFCLEGHVTRPSFLPSFLPSLLPSPSLAPSLPSSLPTFEERIQRYINSSSIIPHDGQTNLGLQNQKHVVDLKLSENNIFRIFCFPRSARRGLGDCVKRVLVMNQAAFSA